MHYTHARQRNTEQTSSCAEMYHTQADRAPMTPKAIVVFLRQYLGLHHQPPEGDHTYTGYLNCLVPPYMYTYAKI